MSDRAHTAHDRLERSAGNGATSEKDALVDGASIFTNEWGSAAATTFDPQDTDASGNDISNHKQRQFEDLYALHNGRYEQSRKGDIRSSHIHNDLNTFCSVLELEQAKRDDVEHVVNNIGVASTEFGGRKYEKIILAICSLVVDKRLSEQHSVHTDIDVQARRLTNRADFTELMDTVGMTPTELREIRTQIRKRSQFF
jgi:hypothetical protein